MKDDPTYIGPSERAAFDCPVCGEDRTRCTCPPKHLAFTPAKPVPFEAAWKWTLKDMRAQPVPTAPGPYVVLCIVDGSPMDVRGRFCFAGRPQVHGTFEEAFAVAPCLGILSTIVQATKREA